MRNFSIPEEWMRIKLGDIVDYGKTQKCELTDVDPSTWVLELEDIEKDTSKILQVLNAENRPFKSTKNLFNKGDVLYGKLRPYLNKVIIATSSGVCSTEIIPLNAEPNIDNRYMFHWIKSETFLSYVNEASYGVNMPRLGTKDGISAPFILPPRAEQKVIADKLDTLLAQVESTKARLEHIPDILKRFRQTVLAAAVSGKLMKGWRVNSAKSWTSTSIGELADFVTSGSRGWAKYYSDSGSIFIRSQDINQDDLNISSPCYVSLPVGVEGTRTSVHKDDILITITGANVTKCARVKVDLPNAYVSQHIALIRLSETKNSAFVELALKSLQAGRKQLTEMAYGGGKPGLNLQNIKDVYFSVPSIEEQTEIVRRVEQLFSYADKIEQQAQSALDRVNNLTQSILAKAFCGELTADWRAAHPELISGENSAEELLTRIRAEREKIGKQSKTKRSRSKKIGKAMSKQIIKIVEALKQVDEPLSGQQLLDAAGYPNNSTTEQLERFFLDIREALNSQQIIKLHRDEKGQDWFALADNK